MPQTLTAPTGLLTAEGAALSFFYTDNYGLQFNGTTSYVTMGPAPGLGSATFTLETWFKRTGAGQTANSGTGGVVAVPLVCKALIQRNLGSAARVPSARARRFRNFSVRSILSK